MLYTMITFVALFIIAVTAAVIYYVKAEEYRTTAIGLQEQKDELATNREWTQRVSLVGSKTKQESYLGKMVDYLDQMMLLTLGVPVPEDQAETKVIAAHTKYIDFLNDLKAVASDIEADPNDTGLLRVATQLTNRLENSKTANAELKKQLDDVQSSFDATMENWRETEAALLAEKDKIQNQYNQIQQDYADLKALLEKTTDKQVQTLRTELDEQKSDYRTLNDLLLKTQAQLSQAEQRMQLALQKVREFEPLPDNEVAAYKSDGKILLIDEQAGIVHINLGSDDRVYPGLTFSIYDKSTPIPQNGVGKAQVEIFGVEKNFSSARIIQSNKRNPMLLGDLAANLIWDRDKDNMFVVAGQFDLNNDRVTDPYGKESIESLIRKWGGKVSDSVSVDTDFVVLGTAPQVGHKPTFEELEIYPNAMKDWQTAMAGLNLYREIEDRAKALSIPIFNTQRFLYLIGYESLATRPGAFQAVNK
ncbi:MAG: hypothetical protein PHF37_09835 [Phycisphaerae bacterium]|nr:hypothetical protein [Phycisphaerae bacterium]